MEIKPKWDWSPEYRRAVRQQMRETGRREQVPESERLAQYIAWYAEQKGISQEAAEKALREQGKIA